MWLPVSFRSVSPFRFFSVHRFRSGFYTALFQVLATSGCNSVNRVSQSESRIQILLQFDWMARFSLLQPDVARTWKRAVACLQKDSLSTCLQKDSLSTTLSSALWESPFTIEGHFTTRPPSLTTTLNHKLMKNSNGPHGNGTIVALRLRNNDYITSFFFISEKFGSVGPVKQVIK